MNYFPTVHGKGFNFRDLRTLMAKASPLLPPIYKRALLRILKLNGPLLSGSWQTCRYDNFSKTH